MLPFFEGVNAETIVKIRDNEAALSDFRKMLREFSCHLPQNMDGPRSHTELLELKNEIMQPAFEKVIKDFKGITALKRRVKEGAIDFSAAALAGFTLSGDITTAATTGGVSVLAKSLIKMFSDREKLRPGSQVVMSFVQK